MKAIKEMMRVIWDYAVFALIVFLIGMLVRPLFELFLIGWHIWS